MRIAAVPHGDLRQCLGRASFEGRERARPPQDDGSYVASLKARCEFQARREFTKKTGARRMKLFTVGKASIARIEETYGPTYRARDIFPEFDDHILAQYAAWLAPSHYDAASGFIKLSVHSWLVKIGGQNILIDGCCGNNKIKPARPFWNLLNIPWLERLAAAGARPEEIDYVMCTHLHHDHVGWNTL
jgi:Metallo-beta-lactamase superfamily